MMSGQDISGSDVLQTGDRVRIDMDGYREWRANGGVPQDFVNCYTWESTGTVIRDAIVGDEMIVVNMDDNLVLGVPIEFITKI